MNENEISKLEELTQAFQQKLIYRASRDGFEAEKFHSKCDNINNTVTVIMNDIGYVFGGYTSVTWNSRCFSVEDSNAYIFSLRRYHKSNGQKFMIKYPKYAINACTIYGPSFSDDIVIADKSNKKLKNYSNFGYAYDLPVGYTYKCDSTRAFLTGSYTGWKTTEIEVYHIIK